MLSSTFVCTKYYCDFGIWTFYSNYVSLVHVCVCVCLYSSCFMYWFNIAKTSRKLYAWDKDRPLTFRMSSLCTYEMKENFWTSEKVGALFDLSIRRLRSIIRLKEFSNNITYSFQILVPLRISPTYLWCLNLGFMWH